MAWADALQGGRQFAPKNGGGVRKRGSGRGRLLGVTGRSYMLAGDTKPLEDCRQGSVGWFAIYTRHDHENLAARSLAYKGYEVFLPQYISVRQWSDRTKELSSPLFPCYLILARET